MRRALVSADDRLLARLQGPPDLSEGVEALSYWHERRRRLSWYRVRARREAARMIVRWEHRVRGAIFSQRGVPIGARSSAGLLLARTRAWRWSRRTAVGVTALVGATLLVAPFIAAVVLLVHLL
jgi:hypothetical protein